MSTAERLKDPRALSIQTKPRRLRLVTDRPDPRELPTDPVGSAPPESAEARAAALPAMNPPPRARMTAEDLRSHPGYNDSDFGCVSALVIVEGQEEVKRSAGAIAEFDRSLDRRFAEQTAAIERAISANYGIVRSEVVALRSEHETFRAEIEALKGQIAALEPLKAKVFELEAKLAKSGEVVVHVPKAAPSPTG